MGSTYRGESTTSSNRAGAKYSLIPDNYKSIEEVTRALLQHGLESSNLIIGIDFTKSNEWTGQKSFNGRSLHAMLDHIQNPYEQAISIIGKTLEPFDEDNLIPCLGFGDVSTHDQNCFSFFPNGQPCNGLEEVLLRYKELVPFLRLAGPTSFAPVINAAIDIVAERGCQYHVLLIIADGQVTRSRDPASGQLSPQESETIDAIVTASKYPLSIVLVGVGDGPWDMMKMFDDKIPGRNFDNFQFVNFTEIMSKNTNMQQREAAFALAALMEVPSQFSAAVELGLISSPMKTLSRVHILPPPMGASQTNIAASGFPQTTSSFGGRNQHVGSESSSSAAPIENLQGKVNLFVPGLKRMSSLTHNDGSDNVMQDCRICFSNAKNMAFNCGHQTCEDCGKELSVCPFCRVKIQNKLRLY